MDTIFEDDEDYMVLGVDKGVTLEELRKAYKKKCLLYHPDKNGSSEDFIRLTEAYQNVQRHIERESANATPENDFSFFSFMCDMLMGYMKKVQNGSNVIKVKISVQLSDVINEKIKKITLKVKRLSDGVETREKKHLYIGLCMYQQSYYFKGDGDEYAPKTFGDVCVIVNIECDKGYSIIDHKKGIVSYKVYVPLYVYLYENVYKFTYLDGSIIEVGFDGEQVIKGKGCVCEDGSYGDLHVWAIPYVTKDVKDIARLDFVMKEKILQYFSTL
jgi:DnaJ-class molecular chaperone